MMHLQCFYFLHWILQTHGAKSFSALSLNVLNTLERRHGWIYLSVLHFFSFELLTSRTCTFQCILFKPVGFNFLSAILYSRLP